MQPDSYNLPDIRGDVLNNAPLGQQSWFRCGGMADFLFEPADTQDIIHFLQSDYPRPLTIIGGLANTIIRDGGIRGTVIKLSKPFSDVSVHGDIVTAGCGALNGNIAASAVRAGIGGLEFLSGIPGSLGGAVAMNAGAYGSEVRDVLIEISGVSAAGEHKTLKPDVLNMRYRTTDLPEGFIVTEAKLRGNIEGYDTVKARMNDIKKKRNDTQPIKEKTGGSTFANPSADELNQAGLPEGMRAWEVVERVGGRGLQIGGAQMSEKHCNFMINTGDAKASDLEDLGEEIRERAKNQLGLNLHWEIKRIGERL